jgi:hypothetical protein
MASFATQVEAAPEHHQKHREPGNEGKPHVHTAHNLTFPKLIQSTVVSVSIIMYDETSKWGHHFSRVFGIREKLTLFYRSYSIVASRDLEPGHMFCNGAGFVHRFTADQLRDRLSYAYLQLEAFRSDAEWSGSGLIRLAVLRCPRSL